MTWMTLGIPHSAMAPGPGTGSNHTTTLGYGHGRPGHPEKTRGLGVVFSRVQPFNLLALVPLTLVVSFFGGVFNTIV